MDTHDFLGHNHCQANKHAAIFPDIYFYYIFEAENLKISKWKHKVD